MDETRKRPADNISSGAAEKRARSPAPASGDSEKSCGEEEDVETWLCIDDEEAASELAKLLEAEAESPAAAKVRFIDDPYSSPVIVQSSSYVTINGNEESCGPSFSDWECSVMASVDIGRQRHRLQPAEESASWSSYFAVAACGGEKEGVARWDVRGTDSSDSCDLGDEMVARFLGEALME
ncbi:hypothetical protein NMG60_11013624 [Bertholletia excelsa]